MNRKESPKLNWQPIYELFQRYFSNTANEKEREIIETWNAPDEKKSKLKLSNQIIEEDRILTYHSLSGRFSFDNPNTFKRNIFIFNKTYRHIAAAASVLLILGVGITLWYSTWDGANTAFLTQQAPTKTLFQTTDAQTKSVVLPDGSRIQMNRGTKFSYATHAFNRKQREVWLTGEAFFEVAKNKEKPFIIHTGTMETTVRGTSFNVKAYPQLSENVVSVRTGRVEVTNRNQMLAVLTPNKQITYNNTTKVAETQDIDAADIAGWTEGKLVLNNASAEELRLRLKQYFNANIQIKGEALNQVMFNSSFAKGTKLNEVMQTICAIYNFRYEITQSGNIIIYN